MSATKKEFFVQNFLVVVAFRWGRKSQRTFLHCKKKYFSQREEEERKSTDRIATARIVTLKFF